MTALFLKEVRSFLNSLIGYIVIGVFLLLNGMFLFVFEGAFNIFEGGEASLYNLFYLAPYVFLFLIPAITMRSFAEEKRLGTLELLLTKPLSDTSIIGSKFLAGFTLVIFSILPTLVYFLCVASLTESGSEVDTGEMWGSYIGLLFLGGAYVAIGTFASSLSGNQVVAFVIALSMCWFTYMGFEYIGAIPALQDIDDMVYALGIYEHYTSISYGVVDSRDMVYFVSVILFFLLLTKVVLAKRKW
jgi:ABC-2 type transport system permease protein